jgi:hypothetical protein
MAIDQLKRHVNIAGPGADHSAEANGSLAMEAAQVWQLVSFHPAVYIARLHLLLTQGLPDLFGARPLPLIAGGIWGDASVGSWLAGGALAAAMLLCAAGLLWIVLKGKARGVRFQVFLSLVSVQGLAAYGLHGGTIEARTNLNYLLLALFLPVALFGAYFQLETKAGYRRAAVLLIVAWMLPTLADSARVAREYIVRPPASLHRMLADYLTKHRIKYAWAGYWDSYRVTFLSRERVIVASTDIVRVPGYQMRVELNRLNAARIVRVPCDSGTHVAEWCVIDPFQR